MILTEQQQIAITHAAVCLQGPERKALLNELEALFAGRNDVGDGELGRALRDLQRGTSSRRSDGCLATAWKSIIHTPLSYGAGIKVTT